MPPHQLSIEVARASNCRLTLTGRARAWLSSSGERDRPPPAPSADRVFEPGGGTVEAMRARGVVESARGLSPFGHLCWGYRDRAEFRARVAEYIADGLAAGQWVEYVGEGNSEQLRAELAGLVHPDHGGDLTGVPLAAGRMGVSPVEQFYRFVEHTDVVDPERSVGVRVAAAEQALAAGYSGFRAVVDATAVTRTPGQRAAFARFEYLIDQKMAALPVTALCAYDLDHRGLLSLAAHARRRGATVVLRTTPSTPAQLVELLKLDEVRVEWPA